MQNIKIHGKVTHSVPSTRRWLGLRGKHGKIEVEIDPVQRALLNQKLADMNGENVPQKVSIIWNLRAPLPPMHSYVGLTFRCTTRMGAYALRIPPIDLLRVETIKSENGIEVDGLPVQLSLPLVIC